MSVNLEPPPVRRWHFSGSGEDGEAPSHPITSTTMLSAVRSARALRIVSRTS